MENKCVICGAEVPEGRHVCPQCESDEMNYLRQRVNFTYDGNPCLHIKDSYKIKSASDIKAALEYIHGMDEYKKLLETGYTRTFQSEYREWKAHNVLYHLGVAKWSTGSVDIDQNESKLRRFMYAILSIF